MKKICINNRDELIMILVDKIAYLLADGNYTKITYISGMQVVLSLGISKVEKIISNSYDSKTICPFVRLGRSVIINQRFVYNINLLKHRLQLSDCEHECLTLQMPKQILKDYKNLITKTIKPAQ
ncbi:MAG: hypothetical protein MSA31_07705 [Bacteroidales bacterium]|nr:hypothetical protein [Bacteroidales bacterium]